MADASETMRQLINGNSAVLAGTREEAMMAESLSHSIHMHGLETVVQNVAYPSFKPAVIAGSLVLTVLFALLSGFNAGVFSLVMAILMLLAAALGVLESLNIPLLSRVLPTSCSQNVIARHPATPGLGNSAAKSRPIVIMAHYDVPCSDFFASPALRRYQPYLPLVTLGSLVLTVLLTLLQLAPLPHILSCILLAVTIVACLLMLISAVRMLLTAFISGVTAGANNNMSAVAAVLGLLDRVHPLMNPDLLSSAVRSSGASTGTGADTAGADAGSAAGEPGADRGNGRRTREASAAPASAARTARRTASGAVRRGAAVLRSLGMVPANCEIVYEDIPAARETELIAPISEEQIASHKAAKEQTADKTATGAAVAAAAGAVAGAAQTGTLASGPAAAQSSASSAASSARQDGASAAAVQEPLPSTIPGATGVLTHEALRAAQEREQHSQQTPAGTTGTQQGQGQSRSYASQSSAAAAAALAPAPSRASQPLDVIISSDEPDAELRQQAAGLPRDVAQEEALEHDHRGDSILNNPKWGTTSFSPVLSSRHVLDDLPDPSIAAVDPYSVSTVETIGEMDPADFSPLNFETGTHDALTPQMIEAQRRRGLDGFDDIASSRRQTRRERRNRQNERIGKRAQDMQRELEQESFSDWLGVDSDFNAQKNGREIGSWDNFGSSDGSHGPDASGSNGTGQQSEPRRGQSWQGGAAAARTPFGLDRTGQAGTGTGTGHVMVDPRMPDGETLLPQDAAAGRAADGTGAFAGASMPAVAAAGRTPGSGRTGRTGRTPAGAGQGQDYAQPGISDSQLRAAAMSLGDAGLVSHEIWFVFLGAAEASHAGARAFLEEYDPRLHNAYYINLECIGAGHPSLILEEGFPRSTMASRAVVNLLGSASEDLGRPLALDRMGWRSTDLTAALRRGRRGVTICGVEDGVPANSHWSKDEPRRVNMTQINDLIDILAEAIRRS